jgi:hypothetical protein
MTLGQRSVERLNLLRQMEEQMNFSVRRITGDGQAYVIDEKKDGVRLEAEIEDFDKYSCRVKSLSLKAEREPNSSEEIVERLRQQADAATRTIRYLSEDLALVELDATRQAAQLRSSPPQKEQRATTYYELMLYNGDSATLKRYTHEKGEHERRSVAMTLTEENFERLVNDLGELISR